MTKRVLHVFNDLRPSGAEVMLRTAAGYWHEHDISAEILSTGENEGTYADDLREVGYKVWHIPYSAAGLFVWRLARLIRKRRVDVIHVHSERVSFAACSAAKILLGIRAVRTVHSNFRFIGRTHWKLYLQRKILSLLGVIHIAISRGVAENELTRYSNRTILSYNWYDDLRFSPKDPADRAQVRHSLGFDSSHFVIGTLGNCAPVKNHTALIRAIATLSSRGLESTQVLRYLHIGETDSGNSEQLLASRLGIGQNVVFVGRTTTPDYYLQAIDLYVMPSLYEGFGIAALEAIAMGIPALLAEVPGLVDFREHFPGICYCQPDPESIADALSKIIGMPRSHPSSTQDLSASRRFGVAAGVAAYARIYE